VTPPGYEDVPGQPATSRHDLVLATIAGLPHHVHFACIPESMSILDTIFPVDAHALHAGNFAPAIS